MKAPDKIYVDYGLIDYHCLDEQKVDGIEYIRKEALLEWAKKEKDKMKNELLSWANARLEKIDLILNKRHDPLFSGQRYLLVDLIEKLNHF